MNPEDILKRQIIAALSGFIRQRPGLELGNYVSHARDAAGHAAYRAEIRSIGRDLREARELLRAVELSSITGAELLDASSRAYSGRLSLTVDHSKCDGCKQGSNGQWERWEHISDDPYLAGYTPCHTGRVKLDYCTGQYWPTEYRRAVCAVCAAALWSSYRDSFVAGYRASATVTTDSYGSERYNGKSPGDVIRAEFRKRFGKGLASRWFS